ncbi:cobalt transporter [Rodentibacter caecimuris]|uniref:Cobalt transporter n=1 Tax=Rodentibacter caecimuris TaxID=1796644 RepID=A0A1V3KQG0_9PAST|nr:MULTISPECIES: cation diffusion facilitator family transporter [Rodentibacter]MDC2825017.1 cation diffusion facilitator family transporter [Rodentibacter pneumotropicus]OOF79922.1 cobalt transporter [Rodentibacter heylii]
MSCSNCCHSTPVHISSEYRKALWIAFGLNFAMFFVEILVGITSRSTSLLSDSLDFFGDSANYLISLYVLPMALIHRAKASLIKGVTMGGFGMFILFTTIYRWFYGEIPHYSQMSIVGSLALLTNLVAMWVLYRFREGDSNMRGVWLCTRNDAIGNLVVILAGVVVYFTQSKYPDLVVAFILSFLAIQASKAISLQALGELK